MTCDALLADVPLEDVDAFDAIAVPGGKGRAKNILALSCNEGVFCNGRYHRFAKI